MTLRRLNPIPWLLILTLLSCGQTPVFADSEWVYKIKKNDPAPFSGILLTEQGFKYYESWTEEKERLSQRPIVAEAQSDYPVLWFVGGVAVGVVVGSLLLKQKELRPAQMHRTQEARGSSPGLGFSF